jgi:hypothetical protein
MLAMVLVLRKLLATLSILGLVASIFAYLASFFGLTPGPDTDSHLWVFAFFGGFILLYLPLVIVEYGSLSDRTFFWKGFAATRPRWTVPVIQIFGAVAMAHFVLFLILTHAASPAIVKAQFVLSDHGDVRRVISRSQYLSLVAWEMRFMASFWIFFYLVVTLYWWFPSGRPLSDPSNT